MEYDDQRCLQRFLLELKRHRKKLLTHNSTAIQTHKQKAFTTFFDPITSTHACKGDTIDQAKAI